MSQACHSLGAPSQIFLEAEIAPRFPPRRRDWGCSGIPLTFKNSLAPLRLNSLQLGQFTLTLFSRGIPPLRTVDFFETAVQLLPASMCGIFACHQYVTMIFFTRHTLPRACQC